MVMNKQEKLIQEKRTMLAVKNNMMGPSGKLGTIAKYLGSPILRQGVGMMDESFLDDPYETPEETIPTSEDEYIWEEGLAFDGLSIGVHIEIIYNHNEKKLSATYKGYPVYIEIAGELHTYAPFPEWETQIDKLYDLAHRRREKRKGELRLSVEEQVEAEKMSFLQRLRMRWGI